MIGHFVWPVPSRRRAVWSVLAIVLCVCSVYMDWCGGAADPLAVLFFCVCFVWVLFCLFVVCLVVAGGLRALWRLLGWCGGACLPSGGCPYASFLFAGLPVFGLLGRCGACVPHDRCSYACVWSGCCAPLGRGLFGCSEGPSGPLAVVGSLGGTGVPSGGCSFACVLFSCLPVFGLWGGLRAPWPLYVFLCFVGMLCAPRLWIRCIILVREVLWRSLLAPSFAEFITVLF